MKNITNTFDIKKVHGSAGNGRGVMSLHTSVNFLHVERKGTIRLCRKCRNNFFAKHHMNGVCGNCAQKKHGKE